MTEDPSFIGVFQQKLVYPSLKLHKFQLDGVNWLLYNWVNNRNSILADEMGLGNHQHENLG